MMRVSLDREFLVSTASIKFNRIANRGGGQCCLQSIGIGHAGCLKSCGLGLQAGQFGVAELKAHQLSLGFVCEFVGVVGVVVYGYGGHENSSFIKRLHPLVRDGVLKDNL